MPFQMWLVIIINITSEKPSKLKERLKFHHFNRSLDSFHRKKVFFYIQKRKTLSFPGIHY